ncbi:hypothetical protein HBH56_088780 [Parastagonospora nodorum]|uniref:Uncharacterized protein n=2 Tax=Phaeosphaeria nodorum (strain SN15 / ATCC MYA-4574 / FGSC 10173) TaxID=321614 RepID=A0A7U2I172_PHANO|nr:hypothetical protein SNOG_04195 [Parastagonospora nodorum SN15]KAH3914396.1 hypothetical protein HBH56_088780 [Parastagonospora nodorum]EAT87955.1 hypothetical protein SNOG_04195 [Parastagonospora nodorum SN15]KAH3936429.1 hypothetical protein HBH54_023420 [Parastagonospora nodorum]KAH3945725.1 hypothetical protein HBH53_140520 [Parastagonospora nodorum]KAH3966321.1 hypothetical protein HBH51_144850 [Parastagonospora nodorum]
MSSNLPTLRQQLGLPEQDDTCRNYSVSAPIDPPTPIEIVLYDLKVIETHVPHVKALGGDQWAIHQQIRRELYEHIEQCQKERDRLQYETDKRWVKELRDIQVRQALRNGFKLSDESRARLARVMNRVLRYEMVNGITHTEAGEV